MPYLSGFLLNDDYTPNWEKIEKACAPKTKMIIINNPHNPTGKIWNQLDFDCIRKHFRKISQIY